MIKAAGLKTPEPVFAEIQNAASTSQMLSSAQPET